MNFEIDIESDDILAYGKKLGTLHRSALPSAVRSTLNKVAFDVKQRTLLKTAKEEFTEREKNFFKANSTVKLATGFDVDNMKSIVGMSEDRIKDKSTNYAVKNLEEQEHGGTIKSRAFVPMKQSRSGNNDKRKVRQNRRLSTINSASFTPTNKNSSANKKQQFIRAVMYSVSKQDGYVLGHKTSRGGRTLFKVDFVRQNIRTRKLQMKFSPIYNVKKQRSFKVKAVHFMEESAKESAKKINEFFKKEAEFQFKKHLG